jgi:hypothetical protein
MRESRIGEPPGLGESDEQLDHNQEALLFQQTGAKRRE